METSQHLYPRFDLCSLNPKTEQMPLPVSDAMVAELPVPATELRDIRHARPVVVFYADGALAHAFSYLPAIPAPALSVGQD
jgi:hypothetical protein